MHEILCYKLKEPVKESVKIYSTSYSRKALNF